MEKFRYSMQNILNVKEKIEAQEKMMFQLATEALREEEQKLQELYDKKAYYEDMQRESMQSSIDFNKVNTYRSAVENTEDLIKKQKINVRKAEQKLEIARKRLEDAIKERKVHEILKENAFEEYKREYEREEQKAVDELISFQYAEKEGSNV